MWNTQRKERNKRKAENTQKPNYTNSTPKWKVNCRGKRGKTILTVNCISMIDSKQVKIMQGNCISCEMEKNKQTEIFLDYR